MAWLAEHTHGMRDPHSAWLLSLLANVMLAPVLLFAPFAGPWIDRRNLRRVVVACDLLRAATVVSIPMAHQLTVAVAPVCVLLFLLFTWGVLFLPAKSSLTPELVPAPQLLAANTWLTFAGIVAAGAGTLGGSWLVDHWGWARALELNAVTYLASAAALFAIRLVPTPRPSPATMPGLSEYLGQLREGWRLVRGTDTIGIALMALGAAWCCGGFLHVAGNLHLQRVLGGTGVERLGLLIAVLAMGAGLSAWFINARAGKHMASASLAGAIVLAGAGLVGFAAARRWVEFAAAAFTLGLAAAPIILIGETMLQQATTPGTRARVFAARDFMMRVVLLASTTAAAWLARTGGAPLALLSCGGVVLAAGCLALACQGRKPSQVS